jgi:YbbR domain-containing protein
MAFNFGDLTNGQSFSETAIRFLRSAFLEDWALKLTALAITLALWLGVTGLSTPTTERITGVRLSLRFPPNNVEVTNSPIKEVDIFITGDKRRIENLDKSKLAVSVDLTDVPTGDHVISLTPETVSIDLEPGVKLDEIQPNKIVIKLENVLERQVEINPETSGDLPEGYEIYGLTATPAAVNVRGPASFVKALSFISTEKIDVTGRASSFVARQISLNPSNQKVTPLEAVVDVAVTIGEQRVERTIKTQVMDFTNRTATVTLYGPKTIIQNLDPKAVYLEITKTADGTEQPKLTLPDDIKDLLQVRSVKF